MQSSEPFYTLSKIAWLCHHGSRWEILLVSLAALAAWGQAGTTLYVARDGNDAAEGTRARPFGSCSTSEMAR
jgi:hypothetical protein